MYGPCRYGFFVRTRENGSLLLCYEDVHTGDPVYWGTSVTIPDAVSVLRALSSSRRDGHASVCEYLEFSYSEDYMDGRLSPYNIVMLDMNFRLTWDRLKQLKDALKREARKDVCHHEWQAVTIRGDELVITVDVCRICGMQRDRTERFYRPS